MGSREAGHVEIPAASSGPGQRDPVWQSLLDIMLSQYASGGATRCPAKDVRGPCCLCLRSSVGDAPHSTRFCFPRWLAKRTTVGGSTPAEAAAVQLGPSATFTRFRCGGVQPVALVRPSSPRTARRGPAAADLVGCLFSQRTVNEEEPAHWTAGTWRSTRGTHSRGRRATGALRHPVDVRARHAPAGRSRAHRLHSPRQRPRRGAVTPSTCRTSQCGPLLGGEFRRSGPELEVGGREASRRQVERDADKARPRRVCHERGVWIGGGGAGRKGVENRWDANGRGRKDGGRWRAPYAGWLSWKGVSAGQVHKRTLPSHRALQKAPPTGRRSVCLATHHRPTRRGQHTVCMKPPCTPIPPRPT